MAVTCFGYFAAKKKWQRMEVHTNTLLIGTFLYVFTKR